jgi:hypothetical protein
VVNYFFFVAEEVRQIMAQLGIRKFDDLIGRADLLDTRKGIEHWKAAAWTSAACSPSPRCRPRCRATTSKAGPRPGQGAGRALIEKCQPAIERARRCSSWKARNVNRSVGAMLSGAVTKVHPEGLPDDTIRIQLEGTGGQSFGAFLCRGITLT